MSASPHFLVICGDGINCEHETARALREFGAKTSIVHINDLLAQSTAKNFLSSYQGVVFPGGFSFGDHLGSGKVLAKKISTQMKDTFEEFVSSEDRLILGICNGLQVLAQLGFFDRTFDDIGAVTCRLIENESGHFINRWVRVRSDQSECTPWVAGQCGGALPVRHAEGRIFFSQLQPKDGEVYASEQIAKRYQQDSQLPLYYEQDLNGAALQAAGICSHEGRVFGLMPHPEAALFDFQRADLADRISADELHIGKQFWKNGVKYFN